MTLTDTLAIIAKPQPAITVDAALGSGWDELGKLITQTGDEDSSGARRLAFEWMDQGEWHLCTDWLMVPEDELREIYARIKER